MGRTSRCKSPKLDLVLSRAGLFQLHAVLLRLLHRRPPLAVALCVAAAAAAAAASSLVLVVLLFPSLCQRRHTTPSSFCPSPEDVPGKWAPTSVGCPATLRAVPKMDNASASVVDEYSVTYWELREHWRCALTEEKEIRTIMRCKPEGTKSDEKSPGCIFGYIILH